MENCTHPRLVRVENIEDGGVDSTIYLCQNPDCNALLKVRLEPETITVVYGKPEEQ